MSELLARHPEPGQAGKATAIAARLFSETTDPDKLAEMIKAAHTAWCEYWQAGSTASYVPRLWRWLSDGEFLNPPSAEALEARRKPPASTRRKSRMEELFDAI